MEREDNHQVNPQSHHHRTIYPSPMSAVEAALAHIESDGSIIETGLEEETNQPYQVRIKPYDPVPLDQLPQDIWCRELLQVATVIKKTCFRIGQDSDTEPSPDKLTRIESRLKLTAHFLTAYRHDREFLHKAASLVKISESGVFYSPELPGGSWTFDPKNIEFRHAPLRIDAFPFIKDE